MTIEEIESDLRAGLRRLESEAPPGMVGDPSILLSHQQVASRLRRTSARTNVLLITAAIAVTGATALGVSVLGQRGADHAASGSPAQTTAASSHDATSPKSDTAGPVVTASPSASAGCSSRNWVGGIATDPAVSVDPDPSTAVAIWDAGLGSACPGLVTTIPQPTAAAIASAVGSAPMASDRVHCADDAGEAVTLYFSYSDRWEVVRVEFEGCQLISAPGRAGRSAVSLYPMLQPLTPNGFPTASS